MNLIQFRRRASNWVHTLDVILMKCTATVCKCVASTKLIDFIVGLSIECCWEFHNWVNKLHISLSVDMSGWVRPLTHLSKRQTKHILKQYCIASCVLRCSPYMPNNMRALWIEIMLTTEYSGMEIDITAVDFAIGQWIDTLLILAALEMIRRFDDTDAAQLCTVSSNRNHSMYLFVFLLQSIYI